MRRALPFLAVFLLALATLGHARADPATEAPYALDTLPREVPKAGPLECPKVELVDYGGDTLRFSSSTKVYIGLRDRLKAFEKIAAEVGTEIYGRPPIRVAHLGTYSCRRIAAYPEFLSEHALGNAIDIAGFDFGPLPKGQSLPEGVPAGFKNGFEVRVLSHWKAQTAHAAIHARFLKTLARRLIARKDVFRVLLGPGYAGHDNHFHFDMAPFRMVEIYDNGQPLVSPPAVQVPADGSET
jgi:hypothetical protein